MGILAPLFGSPRSGSTFSAPPGRARRYRENTSCVAGQDELFFSPLSPTSFASLAVPALNFSGNLWGWIPQVRVEHRFAISDTQTVGVQAGVLDNLTGEY